MPYKWILPLAFLASSLTNTAGAATAPIDMTASDRAPIEGEWQPPDMNAQIRFQPCDGRLCAVLTWQDYAANVTADILNPDPLLRERPLIGAPILDHLERIKPNLWKSGDLYDPRTGKTYHAKLKRLDDNRIKITGCIGPGLCKGYIWNKTPARIAAAE